MKGYINNKGNYGFIYKLSMDNVVTMTLIAMGLCLGTAIGMWLYKVYGDISESISNMIKTEGDLLAFLVFVGVAIIFSITMIVILIVRKIQGKSLLKWK